MLINHFVKGSDCCASSVAVQATIFFWLDTSSDIALNFDCDFVAEN
jgi:hypothetical protein